MITNLNLTQGAPFTISKAISMSRPIEQILSPGEPRLSDQNQYLHHGQVAHDGGFVPASVDLLAESATSMMVQPSQLDGRQEYPAKTRKRKGKKKVALKLR